MSPRGRRIFTPDIVIGLSIAAYRYEGMRFTDFQPFFQEWVRVEMGQVHIEAQTLNLQ